MFICLYSTFCCSALQCIGCDVKDIVTMCVTVSSGILNRDIRYVQPWYPVCSTVFSRDTASPARNRTAWPPLPLTVWSDRIHTIKKRIVGEVRIYVCSMPHETTHMMWYIAAENKSTVQLCVIHQLHETLNSSTGDHGHFLIDMLIVPVRRINLQHVLHQLHVHLSVLTLPHPVTGRELVPSIQDAQSLDPLICLERRPTKCEGKEGASQWPDVHCLGDAGGGVHRGQFGSSKRRTALQCCLCCNYIILCDVKWF